MGPAKKRPQKPPFDFAPLDFARGKQDGFGVCNELKLKEKKFSSAKTAKTAETVDTERSRVLEEKGAARLRVGKGSPGLHVSFPVFFDNLPRGGPPTPCGFTLNGFTVNGLRRAGAQRRSGEESRLAGFVVGLSAALVQKLRDSGGPAAGVPRLRSGQAPRPFGFAQGRQARGDRRRGAQGSRRGDFGCVEIVGQGGGLRPVRVRYVASRQFREQEISSEAG